MKILIYGFGPYGPYKQNFSEKVIEKIKKRNNLKKVIFPVKFKKDVFLEKIKKFKPDFILGLGQYPKGKKIRIERKTMNKWKENEKEKIKKISKKGPRCYFLNLKLKKNKEAWLSYKTTDYACNFSMYVIMDFIKAKNKNIKFGFLHIPFGNIDKVAKFVESRIGSFAV